MAIFRRKKPRHVSVSEFSEEGPVEFCTRLLKVIKEKADHNKDESLFNFGIVIVATLAAPMFITLGEGLILGKVVPSLLSLTAAGATAWLQLRQPQQLWALYRTAQRRLEDQRIRYRYKINDYATSSDPDKLLAERVADIAIELHYSWLPLLPKPESFQRGSSSPQPSTLKSKHNLPLDNER